MLLRHLYTSHPRLANGSSAMYLAASPASANISLGICASQPRKRKTDVPNSREADSDSKSSLHRVDKCTCGRLLTDRMDGSPSRGKKEDVAFSKWYVMRKVLKKQNYVAPLLGL